MSFYSSLILFYPGRSPQLSLGELRSFCDLIRSNFSRGDDLLGVKISYEANDTDEPVIYWDESAITGMYDENLWQSQEWNYINDRVSWQQLWPVNESHDILIRRASVDLGSLPQDLGEEITATSTDGSSYIAPVELDVSVGPVLPMMLDDDLSPNECYGNLRISLSGMGYFTWQSLSAYWERARRGSKIQKMLQTCRDAYSAPLSTESDFLKERLGELFLNQNEYRPGDWIVSVSESG